MKTCVYVDGFNLYYAIRNSGLKWLDLRRLAGAALPDGLVVDKVKYYTARVSGTSDPGQPGRQQVYLNALSTVPGLDMYFGKFLAKDQWRPLLNLPVAGRDLVGGGTTVRLNAGFHSALADPATVRSRRESVAVGSYPVAGARPGGRPVPAHDAVKVQVFAMEEKGSDVNLVVHLVNDGWAGRFEAAAVVSNDTDLVEPIRIVTQELGKPVFLLCASEGGASAPLRQVATGVRHIERRHLRASQFPDPVEGTDGRRHAKPAGW